MKQLIEKSSAYMVLELTLIQMHRGDKRISNEK